MEIPSAIIGRPGINITAGRLPSTQDGLSAPASQPVPAAQPQAPAQPQAQQAAMQARPPVTAAAPTTMAQSQASRVPTSQPPPRQIRRGGPGGVTQRRTDAGVGKAGGNRLLAKKKIQDILDEIKPRETVDDQLEEMLLDIGDEFVEHVVSYACQLAKLRGSSRLEVRDVKLHLERNWDIKAIDIDPEEKEDRPAKRVLPTDRYLEQLRHIPKQTRPAKK